MKPEVGLTKEEFRRVIQRLELSQVALEYSEELQKVIYKLKDRWKNLFHEEPVYFYNKEQLDEQLKKKELNKEQYEARLKWVRKDEKRNKI